MKTYTVTHNSQIAYTIRQTALARKRKVIQLIVLSLLAAAAITAKAEFAPQCSTIPHTQANAELLATCKE